MALTEIVAISKISKLLLDMAPSTQSQVEGNRAMRCSQCVATSRAWRYGRFFELAPDATRCRHCCFVIRSHLCIAALIQINRSQAIVGEHCGARISRVSCVYCTRATTGGTAHRTPASPPSRRGCRARRLPRVPATSCFPCPCRASWLLHRASASRPGCT